MPIRLKRYVAHLKLLELHDIRHEHERCQVDRIPLEHRRWYDTWAAAVTDRPYLACYWCIERHGAEAEAEAEAGCVGLSAIA